MAENGRIREAREGYLTGDKAKIRSSHLPHRIREDLKHPERHGGAGFNLPEIILGGQDGLVNVLGVILGVAAATAETNIVLVAGLAATFAESISMGAVAYTSTIAEADYYQSEVERERYEIRQFPEGEKSEVRELYRSYGFAGKILEEIVEKITANRDIWLRVMMEQELKLQKVVRKDALPAALIVGFSSLAGSVIPLTPFFFLPIGEGIILSVTLSALTLFVIGYYKAKMTLGRKLVKNGLEMLAIGMVSALAGFLVGKLFNFN
ncbi:MAG: CCC1-related iron/manganese transporter component [Candidatus Gottesmanbacteria bacterium GW2011_GWA2_43_14]|uniref:CCC1-related iron/manganese transporter component n=1 Tax=Candidatus Gottesmanbacteria bacterium GW2011_GWA2_43_14 TaxID=1618443 RepID=A0A0G1DK46_9BACT|nr:MAG: CCC1-related iron/manganese transporter component [Candidatus Gottesmanbacteria bacterium GW2011_GWA2_43_14]